MWDTSIHGVIHDPRIRWDARILGIRGYVGYKDTWDRKIQGYEDTGDTRIQGIQGYVGYKDNYYRMIRGIRGIQGYMAYDDMWIQVIQQYVGYMG